MKLLELTLETPEENLALDEALLEVAEAGQGPREVLRLWESPRPVVVLGRSSNAATEVNLQACRQQDIPILRRASGGASVLIGPGCLMYAVVLSYDLRPELRMIELAHRFVLERLQRAIKPQIPEIVLCGTSDLSLNSQKFSGNSLRCRQRHLLYHGTIVYGVSTDLMAACLRTPPRQPAYRQGREHQDFVANIPIDPHRLRRELAGVWQAAAPLEEWPVTETARVVREKYSQPKWRITIDE